jgi:hypothetical protein
LATAQQLSGRAKAAPSLPGSQHAEQKARAERWKRYLDEHNLKPGRRAYAEEQISKYRSDKRRPRRLRDIREEDRGHYRQRTITTWPHGTHREKRNIPKQPSGFWKTIWNHGIKIRKSEKTGNLCIYDKHDEYVDELEELDAFNLAIKLLDSVEGLRVKVHRNIRGNTWKEYIIRSYTQWKKDRGLAFAR